MPAAPAPTPNSKYETILRQTQRRVDLPANDADRVAIADGMRQLDHRKDELVRIEAVLARAKSQVKGRRENLEEQRGELGRIYDRKRVEKLVACDVVHTAKSGGRIFVRIVGSGEIIPGSDRPVSAEERGILKAIETAPPVDGQSQEEALAANLRLMEYVADAAPDDIHAQVSLALEESALPDELQDVLMALEERAEEEEKPAKKGKAKAPKAEKPAKEAKPKKSKPAAAPPPPAPPAAAPVAAAEDPALEPGPAQMERDEPDMPVPPRPRGPAVVPQPPRDDEPLVVEEEPAAAADAPAAEPANDTSASDGAAEPPADDVAPAAEDLADAAESDGEQDTSDTETSEGPAIVSGDEEEDGAGDPHPEAYDADDLVDEGPAAAMDAHDAEIAEDPHPEAYDADADEAEEPWVDPAGVVPAAAPALPVDDLNLDYETGGADDVDDLVVDRTAEPPAPAPALVEPEPPVAAPPAPASPPAEPAKPKAAARKKAEPSTAPMPRDLTDPTVAGYVAPPAAAPPPPAPVVEAPAPTPAAPPPAVPATPAPPARTVDNGFGLSAAVAKRFEEAVMQFLRKEPMLASSAADAMCKKLGQLLTDNMRAAIVPMLTHLAVSKKIEQQAAGADVIFYVPEQAAGVGEWHKKHQRTA